MQLQLLLGRRRQGDRQRLREQAGPDAERPRVGEALEEPRRALEVGRRCRGTWPGSDVRAPTWLAAATSAAPVGGRAERRHEQRHVPGAGGVVDVDLERHLAKEARARHRCSSNVRRYPPGLAVDERAMRPSASVTPSPTVDAPRRRGAPQPHRTPMAGWPVSVSSTWVEIVGRCTACDLLIPRCSTALSCRAMARVGRHGG